MPQADVRIHVESGARGGLYVGVDVVAETMHDAQRAPHLEVDEQDLRIELDRLQQQTIRFVSSLIFAQQARERDARSPVARVAGDDLLAEAREALRVAHRRIRARQAVEGQIGALRHELDGLLEDCGGLARIGCEP
ncbi:MAG: hypothetical protein MUF51_09610 [Vicinamibacteria bacterium]|nr:hypothetical protein [Vicinamibacteria bacterium]